jgi:hypothetical protein
MTATIASTVLIPVQPLFTDAGRVALAGYLAGYRGQTPRRVCAGSAPVHHLVPDPVAAAVRGPPCRHRTVRPRPGRTRPGPRDRHPAAVHDRRVLLVRGRGRTPRPFPGRARPPSPPGLRTARRRTGPQRTRRSPGRRGTRAAHRACADLAAGAERAAGLRSGRRAGTVVLRGLVPRGSPAALAFVTCISTTSPAANESSGP